MGGRGGGGEGSGERDTRTRIVTIVQNQFSEKKKYHAGYFFNELNCTGNKIG